MLTRFKLKSFIKQRFFLDSFTTVIGCRPIIEKKLIPKGFIDFSSTF